MQLYTIGKFLAQALPNGYHHGFDAGHGAGQPGYIEVEILVIEVVNDFFTDDHFEDFEVHHAACIWVWLSFYTNVQIKIVPVEVGVGAFAKGFQVSLIAPIGVPQPVSGIEVFFAGEVEDRHRFAVQNYCLFLTSSRRKVSG